MDVETARILCKITKNFYREHAASFSTTRQSAWQGWSRCLDVWREAGLLAGGSSQDEQRVEALRVLDLACGNLRFETFLAEVPEVKKAIFYAVDDCDDLMQAGSVWTANLHQSEMSTGQKNKIDSSQFFSKDLLFNSQFTSSNKIGSDKECVPFSDASFNVHFQNFDIMEALFDGEHLSNLIDTSPCDLSVSFGFMHHIPLVTQRAAVMQALVHQTRIGGCIAVSFWRFLDTPAYAEKARVEHERACTELDLPPLSKGDCLLGWKGLPNVYRYCHSFSTQEIDSLLDAVAHKARPIARFASDGRGGAMNEYVILLTY